MNRKNRESENPNIDVFQRASSAAAAGLGLYAASATALAAMWKFGFRKTPSWADSLREGATSIYAIFPSMITGLAIFFSKHPADNSSLPKVIDPEDFETQVKSLHSRSWATSLVKDADEPNQPPRNTR